MEISYFFSFQIGVNTFTYSYFIVSIFFYLACDTQKIVYTQTKAAISGTVKPSLYKKFNSDISIRKISKFKLDFVKSGINQYLI